MLTGLMILILIESAKAAIPCFPGCLSITEEWDDNPIEAYVKYLKATEKQCRKSPCAVACSGYVVDAKVYVKINGTKHTKEGRLQVTKTQCRKIPTKINVSQKVCDINIFDHFIARDIQNPTIMGIEMEVLDNSTVDCSNSFICTNTSENTKACLINEDFKEETFRLSLTDAQMTNVTTQPKNN